MKYIVKKDCLLALPEKVIYYHDNNRSSISKIKLDCNQLVQIEHCKNKIVWEEQEYSYVLCMDGNNANCYNTRRFLLDDKAFEEYFRLPVKDHWQVKICTENECNEFLKELDTDCLKDIKMTDNCLMVIYKVKGEVEKC